MAKAILELPEMPESCAECPCKGTDVWGMVRCRLIHMKSDKYGGMAEGYAYKRRPDCPLKLEKQTPQKVKKYKGLNETACPNCRFVFGDYEYDDEKFDYCYNCGQRLSWESEVEHDA